MSLLADRPTTVAAASTPGGARPRPAVMRAVRVITPIGWTAVAAAATFFAASRWTGWQELSVAAIGLAAAVVVASVFVIGRSRYRVVLDLRSERVVVGEPAAGRMLVSNSSGSRLLPVRMELPVGAAMPSISIPSLAKDAVHEELFVIPTARRGVIVVGPARSVRGDAFGLFRRTVKWTEPELLYVHPRTVPLEGTSPGFIQDLEGEATKELSNNDVSFHALRGYVPGDDRRYIHWKTTARTGVVMVRQFEETRRSHLAVALSVRTQDYRNETEFEIAVASAASLGVQAFREERAVSVVPGDRPLRAATARRLLDGIAGVDWSDDADGVAVAAKNTAATVPDVSVAIILCGGVPTAGQIRSAGAAFPVGVRVVAVRVELGAPIAVRRIGTLPILTIGALDDLARALRAVRG